MLDLESLFANTVFELTHLREAQDR